MSEKTFRSGSTSYYSIWKIPQCASFMKIAQPYNGRKITLQCQNLPRIFHASNSNKPIRRKLVHSKLSFAKRNILKRAPLSNLLSRSASKLLSLLLVQATLRPAHPLSSLQTHLLLTCTPSALRVCFSSRCAPLSSAKEQYHLCASAKPTRFAPRQLSLLS